MTQYDDAVPTVADNTVNELLADAERADEEEEELGYQIFTVARTLLDAPVYAKAMSRNLAEGHYTDARRLARALSENESFFTPADKGPETAFEEGYKMHTTITALTEAYEGEN